MAEEFDFLNDHIPDGFEATRAFRDGVAGDIAKHGNERITVLHSIASRAAAAIPALEQRIIALEKRIEQSGG